MSTQARIHPSAVVMGDVKLGNGVSVWPNAVLRGDLEPVFVGENSNVQDCAVLHVSRGLPARIGSFVTIGHNATVHACTVGDNVLIGMGAVILDGAVIGENSMIGAGALVPPGMQVPAGSLVVGVPGQVKRQLKLEEIENIHKNAEEYLELAERLLPE